MLAGELENYPRRDYASREDRRIKRAIGMLSPIGGQLNPDEWLRAGELEELVGVRFSGRQLEDWRRRKLRESQLGCSAYESNPEATCRCR